MAEIVKVFKSTGNKLPVQATPFSGAKDIRADISMVQEKYIHGGRLVWVDKHQETGIRMTNVSYKQTEEHCIRAIELNVGGRVLIPSGLNIQLPPYHSMDVRPRSGLALKYGITCLNTPGLIDEDYRGDVGVILVNHGQFQVIVIDGDRIAQIKVNKDVVWDWLEVESMDALTTTERGEGGFNSSGTN